MWKMPENSRVYQWIHTVDREDFADRVLAASMAYFTGSAEAPSPVSREALRLLG